jgi:hypothetical protein
MSIKKKPQLIVTPYVFKAKKNSYFLICTKMFCIESCHYVGQNFSSNISSKKYIVEENIYTEDDSAEE